MQQAGRPQIYLSSSLLISAPCLFPFVSDLRHVLLKKLELTRYLPVAEAVLRESEEAAEKKPKRAKGGKKAAKSSLGGDDDVSAIVFRPKIKAIERRARQ